MTEQAPNEQRLVGQFGLGNMGAAVASRLSRRFEVLAHDPDQPRARSVADEHGLRLANAPEHVAEADAVVLSLPDPKISRQVVGMLAEHLDPGAVIIETSTVTPGDVKDLAAACPSSIDLVDASILSGVQQMEEGTTTLLIGGEEDAVTTARPVLDALTPNQRRFGGPGSGAAAKVLNNAVAHAVMVVLVEAGAMAAANGVSREELARLLTREDAGLVRPLTHRFMERILGEDYAGGMPTEAARKDSVLALEVAQEQGTPLFAIQAAHTVYELATDAGYARDDYAAIARLWEEWTGQPFPDGTEGPS